MGTGSPHRVIRLDEEVLDLSSRARSSSLSWMRDAACREHPDVNFFPERGQSPEPAKAVCAGCLVREDCLAYALAENIRLGVFGGRSETERRRLRRELGFTRS